MLRGSVPSGMIAAHKFSIAPQADIPRSQFNRSHGLKTTFDEGYLVPILADEMLPGDTFKLNMTGFCRMSTPLFPIMDNMYLDVFFFAVPYRLVWDNWQKFNGEQTNPGDSTDYVVPTVTAPAVGGCDTGSLCDYFGIPTKINSLEFNSLHLRAYNLIWNEWFRDENLQDSVNVPTGDGPDTYADFTLLKRGKRYDYFTSCLPFPQKGPDVSLPLGTEAPVAGNGQTPRVHVTVGNQFTESRLAFNSSGGVPRIQPQDPGTATSDNYIFWGSVANPEETGLVADLSDATAATINDLRLAFQTQKLYERDARGGTRYTEIIKSHFGVTSPDFRLQRPEVLGTYSCPIIINPVAQTTANASPTNKNTLGNLGAYGVAVANGAGFTYSATEHMLLIGLACVRADLNYQQGLDRMWSRQTRLDFYLPVLSHLGEQAVLNKEIYAQGNATDDEVFGYQERFAEYRYKPSLVTGLFRSNATGTLDAWHLAQNFASLPVLNDEFIEENAPMSRVEAVSTEPDFKMDIFFDYKCARPMPVYAVPGLIDHF